MNLAAVDLNLLKAADALLRELSVTRAADEVGVTQQAMSGQLRRLRDLFEDPILVQRGRRLVPTPLGTAIAQPIREALMQIERALVTRPAFNPLQSDRSFTIATFSYVRSTLIPPLLSRLSAVAPSVSLTLLPVDLRFQTELAENRVDMCIVNSFWRANQGLLLPEIRFDPLYEDEFVCVCDGRFFAKEILTLADYVAARHIEVILTSGGLTSVQKAWIRYRMTPHVSLRQESFTDVLFALQGTALVATIQKA